MHVPARVAFCVASLLEADGSEGLAMAALGWLRTDVGLLVGFLNSR